MCQTLFGAEKSEDDNNNKYIFLSKNVALLLFWMIFVFA